MSKVIHLQRLVEPGNQCKVGVSYLGDMEMRMQLWRIGWLTNKDVSLIMRGRLYSSCVRRNENVMASEDENGQALS